LSYTLKIDAKQGYLHFIVTGQNTKENVARYLDQVLRECTTRKCHRALIEERLEGPRLATLDVFSIASEGALRAIGQLHSVAYVDVHAQGDMMKFAETVAVNRAMPVRLFKDVGDAERWLLEEIQKHAEPNAAADVQRRHG
jgi:hypothetical protein